MTMPFYVSPEQQMRDRADYVRKQIARGRGAIVLQYDQGIALVAENRHPALHKISEIYDRIAFAAIGRYNEFEALRQVGVRMADMQGYSFDRTDVTALFLANRYAGILGTIFSSAGEKPYEVETLVVEVGSSAETDQLYRLTYDGSVVSETGFAAMGGSSEQISTYARERYQQGMALAPTLRLAVEALGQDSSPARELGSKELEVAVLDRTRPRVRKFKRIVGTQLERLLAETAPQAAGEPVEEPDLELPEDEPDLELPEDEPGNGNGNTAGDETGKDPESDTGPDSGSANGPKSTDPQ